ncbi:hypothetical protein DM807_25655 [Pseudomonas hunanensis]|nr:hypothetical protein [Pseudomonas hunanensis]
MLSVLTSKVKEAARWVICRTKISEIISIIAVGALPSIKSITMNINADKNAIALMVPMSLEFNVVALFDLEIDLLSINEIAKNAIKK